MTYRLSQLTKITITVLFILILILYFYLVYQRLENVTRQTGWLLLGLIVVTMLLPLMRKFPAYRIAKMRVWSQCHIYLSVIILLMFAIHSHGFQTFGYLESIILYCYIIIALSGFIGLFVYRWFPKRLTRHGGDDILYEKIPIERQRVRETAEQLILQVSKENQERVLADFYMQYLNNFFLKPHNIWRHILGISHQCRDLILLLKGLRRYLSRSEQKQVSELMRLIRQKDRLDYHYALQSVLKFWLLIHIPFAYSFLLFVILHIIVANAFMGT